MNTKNIFLNFLKFEINFKYKILLLQKIFFLLILQNNNNNKYNSY
jgi:hypothetical protein